MDAALLYEKLFLPLVRLLLVMSLGLLVANLLEALHWTRMVARLSSPIVRMANLSEAAAASFSLAFFSPSAANAMLAESHEKGLLSRKEIILANLFNSSPSYLVHLPSVFSLMFAFLGKYALIYVSLTFLAATLRTLGTLVAGKLMLPPRSPEEDGTHPLPSQETTWKETVRTTLHRFRKRIFRLILFTIPVYCLVFAMQQAGWLIRAEQFLADHAGLLSFLDPQSFGIVALSFMAESNLALSAAAPLLESGVLTYHQVILALLIGNILSSPIRAFRHQLPAYAGYFKPALASEMVTISQCCRTLSLMAVTALYYWLVF